MWERARLQISCQLMRSNLAGPPRRRRIPETCYHSFGSQKGTTMRWYHYVAYFFGGAFLANTLPHLGNGISGHAFQSPFASPPGVGLSSSTVNVLWGLFNLAVEEDRPTPGGDAKGLWKA